MSEVSERAFVQSHGRSATLSLSEASQVLCSLSRKPDGRAAISPYHVSSAAAQPDPQEQMKAVDSHIVRAEER